MESTQFENLVEALNKKECYESYVEDNKVKHYPKYINTKNSRKILEINNGSFFHRHMKIRSMVMDFIDVTEKVVK